MNYNDVFAPTAAAERFIKAHALNFTTYALIAAVVILTVIKSAFDLAAEQVERLPEYRIRIQLFKVRSYRRVVQWAIKAEQARLQYAPRLTAAMDRIFCLEV